LRLFIDFILGRGKEQVVDSAWWSRDELNSLRIEVMTILAKITDPGNKMNLLQELITNSTSSYAYIGSPGTGAAFHKHGVAFNALACGIHQNILFSKN